MREFVAVDVETTGLDPTRHELIEVAFVTSTKAGDVAKVAFSLDFDEAEASQAALDVNGWGQRPFPPWISQVDAMDVIREMTQDKHLVGKNPAFDAGFLTEFLTRWGLAPPWHHRLVDVGSLAWGYYNGVGANVWMQPPDTDQVGKLMGIPRPLVDGYHSALTDAGWAWEVFNMVMKG